MVKTLGFLLGLESTIIDKLIQLEHVKRRKFGNLIRENHPEFIAIQETKLEMVDDRLCRSL